MAKRRSKKKSLYEVWRAGREQAPYIIPPELRAVQQACRKYQAALEQGTTPKRVDGNVSDQVEGFQSGHERMQFCIGRIKQLLGRRGVSLIQFFPYYNFGHHVDKICREHEGKTLIILTRIAIAKWVAMSLDQDILEEICEQVFTIDVKQTDVL